MPAVRTSVVRIVEYKKEEYLDRHESHNPPAAGKRPYLLLLTPSTLQLVTASDATDSSAGVSSNLLQLASIKPDRTTLRGPVVKPLALLQRLSHTKEGASADGSRDGEPDDGAAAREDRLLLEDDEPLQEGQLLTFSIALSQVVGVEAPDERRVKVLFGRQKPHRSTESTDDWKYLMKSVILPLALPWEGWKHGNYSVSTFLNRHRRDPFVSSVCFMADNPQEAASLRLAIEDAIGRLSQAVSWLAKDLPLHDRPVVTLVTATTASGSGLTGRFSKGGGAADGGGGQVLAGAAAGAEEDIVAAFPPLKQPLEIPIVAPASSSTGDGSSAYSAPEAAAAAAAAAPPDELAVNVWLHSPLGPAVATIREEQLRRSADSGAPVCVVALPHDEQAGAAAAAAGRDTLEVVLQFTASRQPLPAPSPSRMLSRTRDAAPAAASLSTPAAPAAVGAASTTNGTLCSTLALLAVPLLAAWVQLVLVAGGPAGAGVLQSVAFLVSSLAAIVGIVLVQLKAVRPSLGPAATEPVLQAGPVGYWRLVLLHADLVSESRRRAGAPTVQRVVSSSPPTLTPAPSGIPAEGGAVELPAPIRRLVDAHPGVLTDDIAARFLVGLGQADKAYQAIRSMVEWVEAQGVADLVRQPQPRFELIKQHYPQVFYCWSTRADCVLEVECTGRWRAAFDALRAQGVSERDLLRHQFFCMEYAFRVLDPRPLPQGKTVKIIDLEGLGMRDVGSTAFKWYLQVGGALLAVNYPQRLHKAFLLNAPTWSGVIWRVLAAVIPRKTREQLMLFTKKQREEAAEALMQWVPAEQLPVRYGGKCSVPLGNSMLEQDMLAYVRQLNKAGEAAGGTAAASAESSAAADAPAEPSSGCSTPG